ncbi:MAG: RNA polymerase sigma factor [Acidobacteriota bacterium]|nr:RNA polymerase sigma factor [Acidobacteriota bacterium]MDH3783910.1 RNA polymerase sigma factor [Acidobacteriota bacterium]
MKQPTPRDLFDRHHLPVFRFLRRLVGGHQQAEDLTQEVFLRVVRGIESYRVEEREAAWVFTIARNVYRDHQRNAARRPEPVSLEVAGPVPIDPVQHLSRSIVEALQHLAEPEREAFLMREVSGMSYVEIAAAVEATPDAVRNRIHRARGSLRRLLSTKLSKVRSNVLKEA